MGCVGVVVVRFAMRVELKEIRLAAVLLEQHGEDKTPSCLYLPGHL